MTALANFVLGPCVPRVYSAITLIRFAPESKPFECPAHGIVLSHLPGKPIAEIWPSLTAEQRQSIKAEICRLILRMRQHKFSYYGRPTGQPYIIHELHVFNAYKHCTTRLEWDDSRVNILLERSSNTPKAKERAVALERVQRETNVPEASSRGISFDRPVLTHGDLSDRNILVDPETLAITGLLDWEMGNVVPAYFEYVNARLSWGHDDEWRVELLDVLRSVLRQECNAVSNNDSEGEDLYKKTLAAWNEMVNVERIAQGFDDDCHWTFETPPAGT